MRTLKIVFKLDNDKTTTCSLVNPKTGLTAAEVQTVTDYIIAQQALVSGGSYPVSVKEAYILDSTQTPLA